MKLETILTLHNDPSVNEKITVMHKYEAMFDDERNFNDDFLDKLEESIELGCQYKLTIEKVT